MNNFCYNYTHILWVDIPFHNFLHKIQLHMYIFQKMGHKENYCNYIFVKTIHLVIQKLELVSALMDFKECTAGRLVKLDLMVPIAQNIAINVKTIHLVIPLQEFAFVLMAFKEKIVIKIVMLDILDLIVRNRVITV